MSVQTTQAPRLQDVTALAAEALAAAPLFVSASTRLKTPDPIDPTGTKTVVIKDDGTTGRKALIDDRLRARGIAVVVMPIQEAKPRDQAGPAWLCDSAFTVEVRVNSDRNADTENGGAGVDIYEAVAAVIQTLTTKARHPGGEFFRFLGFSLVQLRDEGLWTYELLFSKENIK